jgi:hypothetical protein
VPGEHEADPARRAERCAATNQRQLRARRRNEAVDLRAILTHANRVGERRLAARVNQTRIGIAVGLPVQVLARSVEAAIITERQT